MREIKILGLNLRDYTVRETLHLVDQYLKSGVLNTIEYVSAQMIMSAEKDSRQKEWLESMDILVYCDSDIIRAANVTSRSRLKEIENNSFLKEFLKKLVRERRTVYLLADTDEMLGILEADMEKLPVPIAIAGKNVLQGEAPENSADIVINDIKDKAPDVLLVLSAYPDREAFIHDNKNKINAHIWLGLQKDSLLLEGEEKGLQGFVKGLRGRIFRRKVHLYKDYEKTER